MDASAPSMGKVLGPSAHPVEAVTVSRRQYREACAIAVTVYVIVHTAVEWAKNLSYMACGGMLVGIFLQVTRVTLSNFREDNDIGALSSFYASICVNMMSVTSLLCALLLDWGGTCEDVLGVRTPASFWSDILVTVPLMTFIALSADDKPRLSGVDFSIILSLTLVIVLGGFMLATTEPLWGHVWRFFSLVSCSPLLVMITLTKAELRAILAKASENQSRKGAYQRKVLLAMRKATLATGLGCALCMFTVLYALAVYGLLSQEVTQALFTVCTVLSKLFFSSLCMNAHLEVSHSAAGLIDAEHSSASSRRAFLRYVFHEVRVPLNSVSLGIQILADRDNISQSDQETIDMMRDATTFMGEVLNDVMALQRIEEGSLELIKKPFTLSELFQTISESFWVMGKETNVLFRAEIHEDVPANLVGDKFRIGHVLANLVSNAIKFSHPQSEVLLSARLSNDPVDLVGLDDVGDKCLIQFSVQDTGRGISEEDQAEDIFQPFRNLKHGELLRKSRGSGLGLAICRELVHMHNGKIFYSSKPGVGSVFHVLLPLQEYAGEVVASRKSKMRSRMATACEAGSHLNVLNSQLSAEFTLSSRSSSSNAMLSRSSSTLSTAVGVKDVNDQWDVKAVESTSNDARESTATVDHDLPPESCASPLGSARSSIVYSPRYPFPLLAVEPTIPQEVVEAPVSTSAVRVRSPRHSFSAQKSVRRPGGSLAELMKEAADAVTAALGPEPSDIQPPMGEHQAAVRLGPADVPKLVIPHTALIASGAKDPAPYSHVNALVVDDVLSNRKLLALLLTKRGLQSVAFAENGQAALEAVDAAGVDYFDIIFMDNTMPVMTGIEATHALRQRGFHSLIIGVTGNSMEDEIQDFVQSGADLVITKPMKANVLEQLLAMVQSSDCLSHPDKRLYLIENAVVWINRRKSHSNA